MAGSASVIATGGLLGTLIFYSPSFLSLALVPGRARDYAVARHKESKKEGLLKPVKYLEFKI